ncbi:MAG: VOC family protein [Methylococcales bacterium]|nr:VOC family protein [Methylococcales bacterium]
MPPTPALIGIAETVLYTDNIEAIGRFYKDVLGFHQTMGFGASVFLQINETSTLIIFDRHYLQTRTSIIPHHGTVGEGHVAFSVPRAAMADWRQHLIAHNIEIEHEQKWPYNSNSIYFRDPDNNSVEVIEAIHYPTVWEQRVKPQLNNPE